MMTIVLLILAYLLGSIPSGLWIGQVFFNINLREHGSGNTGTTNTFRILGKKAGMATFVIDFFKGTLATLLPLIFHVQGVSPIVFGLLAVIGHTFPIFAKFKGGKAVATSAGVIFGFAPLFCLYLAVIFFGILYLGSMISLSSISAAIAAIIGVFLFPLFGFILTSYDLLFTLIIIGLASLVIVRHKDNIKRIQNKTENIKIIEEIYLEDELFSYLEDTLFWIPSKTLSDFNLNTSKGLNRHGITILDKTSSVIMYNIFSGWYDIFKQAPEIIELTGDYIIFENQNGRYEDIKINKQHLINVIDHLKNYSIALEKQNYYIIHLGI